MTCDRQNVQLPFGIPNTLKLLRAFISNTLFLHSDNTTELKNVSVGDFFKM